MTAMQPAPPRQRPTLWIALTVVFGLAAVALAVWAATLKSDLDTAEADLASTRTQLAAEKKKADGQGIAGGLLATAVGGGVAALQNQLGLDPTTAAAAQQQLADAKQRADEAAQALADAGSQAAAKAQARADVAEAKISVAVACARAAAGVIQRLVSGSGDLRGRLAAAVNDLGTLGPQCRAAFAAP